MRQCFQGLLLVRRDGYGVAALLAVLEVGSGLVRLRSLRPGGHEPAAECGRGAVHVVCVAAALAVLLTLARFRVRVQVQVRDVARRRRYSAYFKAALLEGLAH